MKAFYRRHTSWHAWPAWCDNCISWKSFVIIRTGQIIMCLDMGNFGEKEKKKLDLLKKIKNRNNIGLLNRNLERTCWDTCTRLKEKCTGHGYGHGTQSSPPQTKNWWKIYNWKNKLKILYILSNQKKRYSPKYVYWYQCFSVWKMVGAKSSVHGRPNAFAIP